VILRCQEDRHSCLSQEDARSCLSQEDAHSRLSQDDATHAWNASNTAPTPDSWWSVAVRFRCGEEGVCELWAAGCNVPGPESLQPAGLLRVLNAYGKHFAEHPEQVVELSQADEYRPDSASSFKERRAA
jgi:hypothetical protein